MKADVPVESLRRQARVRRRSPLRQAVTAARSVFEGMAVTLSHMFRPPITVQYPDRIPQPIAETLPERYRGFLEVDLDICTGCKACERDCPINCITIDLEKVGEVRAMTRFDIDLGKCMYCNICVESCPIPGQASGDEEPTKSIRMTREFEASTVDFNSLTFRFIRPGDAVVPFKPKKKEQGGHKGQVEATAPRGSIAREVRRRAFEYNSLAAKWAHTQLHDDTPAAVQAPAVVARRRAELEPMVRAAGDDPRKLEDLMFAQALAQTDCGTCGYDTCRAYASAVLTGAEDDRGRCEPGGLRSARDVDLILELRVNR